MSWRFLTDVDLLAWWATSPYALPTGAGVLVSVVAGLLGWFLSPRRQEIKMVALPRSSTSTVPDPFVEGSQGEQRKAYRREGTTVEVLIATCEANKGRPLRAWVRDRSVGGLCLDSATSFKEGTRLTVLPVNAPNMTPWTELEVRSCRHLDQAFEVGCQFIKTPPWAIMLLFG